MRDQTTTRTVVVDTTVVINLIKAGRLDLLGVMKGWEFVVPDQVVEEVTYPEEAGALQQAFETGEVHRESATAHAEIAMYAELKQRMGKGEAACLAMAACRGWMMASDDRGRAFLRLAQREISECRLIGTSDIVRIGLRQGALSAEDADRIREMAGQGGGEHDRTTS